MTANDPAPPTKQLLHLVFGGELKSLQSTEFANIEALDIIGIYPNYAEAHKAWKAAAQRSVDNAHMRYFIIHAHKLLDPDSDEHHVFFVTRRELIVLTVALAAVVGAILFLVVTSGHVAAALSSQG